MKLTLLGIDIKKNQRSFINLLERYGVNRRTRCFCEIHRCCKVMTFWFAGYLSIFCEFVVVDHGTFLLPICQTSLSNRIRKKKAKQLPIMLKRNLKKRSIVKLTPSSLSRTKLSSMAPIHSRDPINDGSLSPISTSTCWISLRRNIGAAIWIKLISYVSITGKILLSSRKHLFQPYII